MKRQSGFTLVEIAIVLVVIGLLLGGVLKGQELVLNSKIRSAINEYNNVASAMFAYQDRYRQLPGDDSTADDRWSVGGTDADPGDGNGGIDGANVFLTGTSVNDEVGYFWQHLRLDGLVTGSTDLANDIAATRAPPRNSFDGYTGVQDSVLNHSGLDICQSHILVKAADIIDRRIDDGSSDSGGLVAASHALTAEPGLASTDAPAASYDFSSSNRYTLCRQM